MPYTDSKPVGAADFYFAINATFRFIENRFGPEGLRRYWQDLGKNYYTPISAQWKEGGLHAVAEYWRAFFQAEPEAEVHVEDAGDQVLLHVRTCPAIRHLRLHGREIHRSFCQHCYFVSEAMAEPAGYTVRIKGGNGTCEQTFCARAAAATPQDLAAIKEAQ